MLSHDRVAVNFVSSIDGVVSLGLAHRDSRAVGGGVPADRLLMAMLRALAGVIVVGAGTLRATLHHQWTAAALAPEHAADLETLRRLAWLPAAGAPLLVVAGRQPLPREAEALAEPAVPVGVVVPNLETGGDGTPEFRAPPQRILCQALALSVGGPILCEGGPTLLGSLLASGVAVDLFLTVAPQLSGNAAAERRSLVEGQAFGPFERPARLRSVRRAADHVLLRYALDGEPVGAVARGCAALLSPGARGGAARPVPAPPD